MGKAVGQSEMVRDHLVAWRASGLTQAAYCASHDLKATTFKNWVCREREDVTLPLTLVPSRPGAPHSAPAAGWRLHYPSGWTLELPATLNPIDIGALLRQLT